MALFTQAEFSEKCQMPSRTMAIHISRKKVIRDEKGFIDEKNEINAMFLRKREAFLRKNSKKQSKEPKVAQKNTQIGRVEPEKSSQNEGNALIDLTEKRLQRQVEKLESEIRKNNAQFEKLSEAVLPRDHAVFLVRNYAAGIGNVWLTATERFLMQTGTALGLSKAEMLKHKEGLTDIVNEAIKDGANEAEKNIKKLAAEFAGKKGRGERDD